MQDEMTPDEAAQRQKQKDEWPNVRRRLNTKSCLVVRPLNRTFVMANKCGATTAITAIRNRWGCEAVSIPEAEDLAPYHELVFMWRDPFERAESIYRWAHKTHPSPAKFGMFPDWGRSFPDWVRLLVNPPADLKSPEWYDLHACSQTLLESILWRQPDTRLAWDWDQAAELFDCEFPAKNASDHSIECMWFLETTRLLTKYWRDDVTTWERINGT